MTTNEWLAIGPWLAMPALAILVVIVDMIWPHRDNLISAVGIVGTLAIMGLVVVAGPLGSFGTLPATGQEVFSGVYVRDSLTAFLDRQGRPLDRGIAHPPVDCFAQRGNGGVHADRLALDWQCGTRLRAPRERQAEHTNRDSPSHD